MSGRLTQRAFPIETDHRSSIRRQNPAITKIVDKRAQASLRCSAEAEGRRAMVQPPEAIIPPM